MGMSVAQKPDAVAGSDRVRRLLAELKDPEIKRAIEHDLRLQERDKNYARRRKAVEGKMAGLPPDIFQRVLKAMEEVHTQGYSVVHGLLEGERLERVRQGMDAVFHGATIGKPGQGLLPPEADREKPPSINVENVFAKTRAVDEVGVDPLLRALVAAILGDNFYLGCCHAKCPFPGSAAQGLHRDDGRFEWTVTHPHRPMICNTLIALDDFTKENGGTMFIPGSHVWDSRRKPTPDDQVAYLEMPAGAMFIFDGALWHAGGGNKTRDQVRRTICLNYTPDWLRPIENHTLSVPLEVAKELPRALQTDLGFYASKTFLGNIEGQQPMRFLQKRSNL
mmetsp:Transcript_124298/g.264894  ORF Transcript_124298/g.264894 Transcript_124298/m.264894 type:complete len:335 (-) Transcript_124298:70-1074(-)